MKKLAKLGYFAIGALSVALYANKQNVSYQDYASKTFFDVRPYFQNGPEQNSMTPFFGKNR